MWWGSVDPHMAGRQPPCGCPSTPTRTGSRLTSVGLIRKLGGCGSPPAGVLPLPRRDHRSDHLLAVELPERGEVVHRGATRATLRLDLDEPSDDQRPHDPLAGAALLRPEPLREREVADVE